MIGRPERCTVRRGMFMKRVFSNIRFAETPALLSQQKQAVSAFISEARSYVKASPFPGIPCSSNTTNIDTELVSRVFAFGAVFSFSLRLVFQSGFRTMNREQRFLLLRVTRDFSYASFKTGCPQGS